MIRCTKESCVNQYHFECRELNVQSFEGKLKIWLKTNELFSQMEKQNKKEKSVHSSQSNSLCTR